MIIVNRSKMRAGALAKKSKYASRGMRITEQFFDREQIRCYLLCGGTVKDIAALLGCSKSTVGLVKREMNLYVGQSINQGGNHVTSSTPQSTEQTLGIST